MYKRQLFEFSSIYIKFLIYIILNRIILVVYLSNNQHPSKKLKNKILFFASLREIADKSSMEIEIPNRSTIEDVINFIKLEIPALSSYFESIMIAVNMIYVENTYIINENDEIALIPPASGG